MGESINLVLHLINLTCLKELHGGKYALSHQKVVLKLWSVWAGGPVPLRSFQDLTNLNQIS